MPRPKTLEGVIAALAESNIQLALISHDQPVQIDAMLGSENTGLNASFTVPAAEITKVAHWAIAEACRCFPTSAFAAIVWAEVH